MACRAIQFDAEAAPAGEDSADPEPDGDPDAESLLDDLGDAPELEKMRATRTGRTTTKMTPRTTRKRMRKTNRIEP